MIHARPQPHPRHAAAAWDRPRLLGLVGGYGVEAAMHEVDLHDGSLHALHFVTDPLDPEPRSRHLRAVTWFGATVVFDLTRLAPTLRDDLPGYLDRDRPGLIKYTLRPLYRNAATLRAAVYTDRCWLACGALGPLVRAAA